MKKIFLTSSAVCILAIGFAQNNDSTSIKKQVDLLVANFMDHRFSRMKDYCTEDVEWINIVGMRWKGLEQVRIAHEEIFNNVPFVKKKLDLRKVSEQVYIAYLLCRVGDFFPPDGVDHGNNKFPAADNMLFLVYVKKGGKWLLANGQNTQVSEQAAKSDPINYGQ